MTSGVYAIINISNGKRYIGSSVNIEKRWDGHRRALNNNKHHSIYLQRAWNKYGSDSFEFSIIETCFVFALIFREQHYINLYSPAYNISPTAGSPLGVKHTAETRAKMSAFAKNRSPEHRAKLSEAHKNPSPELRARMSEAGKKKFFSAEARANMSVAQKGNTCALGHKCTEEVKAKMSADRKGKPLSAEARAKRAAALIGHVVSDETRAKLSSAQKKRYHHE